LTNAKGTGKYRAIRASQTLEETTLASLVNNMDLIISQQKREFDVLGNTRMSDADVLRFFADVVKINLEDLNRNDPKTGKPVVATKARNMLDALHASYKHAPGAGQGTAWDALNAVTHFATHVRTVRDTAGDGTEGARVASNMFGDSATMKREAMARLLALPVAA
jgi:hypothetical protein